MAKTGDLIIPSASLPSDKGKEIEVTDVAAVTHDQEQENRTPSVEYSDAYLDLENVPGIDLKLLSPEDLTPEKWWKQYPPPSELVWSSEDSSYLKQALFEGWAEALEGVFESIKSEPYEKEETLSLVTPREEESSKGNPADAPEVLMDAITPADETSFPRRNPLRISVGSNITSVPDFESPVSPQSVADLRSIVGSISSTDSKRSKDRRERSRYDLSGGASLIYASYFTPLPANDCTVVSMPVSPRIEQVKRFWRKSLGTGESECSSCLNDHKNKKLAILACQHRYCFECLETLVKTAIQDESLWPPRCCIQDIPQKTIEKSLNKKDRQLYYAKVKEYAIPAADRVYCPHPACSAWIPPSGAGRIVCGVCKNSVCSTCRGIAHPAQADCPEDFELQLTLEEGERRGWIRCFQCRAMVERSQGCNHITCKCGAQFCYICGLVWKTCACTGNEAIHRRAAREAQVSLNRAERAREQERERAELAMSLRAIEEMERRDQIAAEEAARKEVLRRRKLQERWLKRISAEYETAEKQLLILHQKQWIIMRDRHMREKKDQEIDFENRESESEKRFNDDMATLLKSQRREGEDRQVRFAQAREELTAKHASEEDEYWFELQTFLRGRPNKEARQKSLMERFNESQKEQLNALLQHQEQISAQILSSHLEQKTNFTNSGTKGRVIEKEMAMMELKESTKRQWAEIKWFVAVQMARNSSLVDMWEAAKEDEEAKQNLFQARKAKTISQAL